MSLTLPLRALVSFSGLSLPSMATAGEMAPEEIPEKLQ
jgi:hypothetical protein